MFDITSKLFDRLVVTASQCWEFTGACDSTGYGIVWKDGRNQASHILSYKHHKGPVQEGLLVLHTCDNPPCCNPEHLFLGTKKDNYDDMVAKGRGEPCHRRGEDNNTTVLTEEAVIEIYRLLDLGYSQRDIGAAFGINHSSVGAISRGKNWKHLYEVHRQ